MTSYSRLNEEEKKYVLMNPVRSFVIKECQDDAERETEQRFGYNGRNDETDAFRHCMWSGLISKRISHSEAIKFTTMHEMQDGNDFAEKSMDLHNNKVGAEIGQNVGSERSIADECYKALQQGKLKFY
ncbi:DUF6973 domain-containing protein [Desulfomicrobium salsuginis]